MFASFAVANREPNRNNYTDAGPTEKPTSERLYDTELGYNHQSDGFSFGANVYYMKYKNQLILNGKMSEIGELLTSNIPDIQLQNRHWISLGSKISRWIALGRKSEPKPK